MPTPENHSNSGPRIGVDLRPYEQAAIDTLGIGVDQTAGLRRWRHARWEVFASLRPGNVARLFETVNEIMTGKYMQNDEHFEVLHRVLHLHEYGLSAPELWARKSPTELVLDLNAFTERLRAARTEHADPMRLFRQINDDTLAFEVSPDHNGPAPVHTLVFGQAERRGGDRDDDKAVVFKDGSVVAHHLVPRATGHVLLISRRDSDGRLGVLNELLDRPRTGIVPANKLMSFTPKPMTGPPLGVRDLIAVNWPQGVEKADHDLIDLFARKGPEMDESELRRIAAAIAQTAANPPDTRVTAAVQRIRIT